MSRASLFVALVVLSAATLAPPASGEVLDRSVREKPEAEAWVANPKKLTYSIEVTSAFPARFKARVALRCFSKGHRVGRVEQTFYSQVPVRRRLPLPEGDASCFFRVSAVPWVYEDIPIGIAVTLFGRVEREMTTDEPRKRRNSSRF